MKISSRDARPFIRKCEPFKTHGALSAEVKEYVGFTGQLPVEHARVLMEHVKRCGSAYVVYSYATPIAWHTARFGWYRPEHKYSVTTSKHQGMCPGTEVRD